MKKWFIGLVILASGAFHATGDTLPDGIYAAIDTTLGSFTGRLDYVEAPITVANFIGLAEGSRAWLDLNTGEPSTNKFYNGITFHRVISGFVIQGGSPNGQGTDGPGYSFVDEVDNGLTHSGPGIFSMANSGLHSNGSQFFVTLAATTGLDGRHTVFGEVISGIDVVNTIGSQTTDGSPPIGNDKPLTDVVIEDVTIIRCGSAAQAFDITAQSLPIIDYAPISNMTQTATASTLFYSPEQYASYNVLLTSNLTDRTRLEDPIFFDPPSNSTYVVNVVSNAPPIGFYAMSKVAYQQDLLTPSAVTNRDLEVTFTGSLAGLRLTLNFDNQNAGTYEFFDGTTTSTSNITSYAYIREPLRIGLRPIRFNGLVPMNLFFDTATPAANRWNGTAFTSPSTSLQGTYRFLP